MCGPPGGFEISIILKNLLSLFSVKKSRLSPEVSADFYLNQVEFKASLHKPDFL